MAQAVAAGCCIGNESRRVTRVDYPVMRNPHHWVRLGSDQPDMNRDIAVLSEKTKGQLKIVLPGRQHLLIMDENILPGMRGQQSRPKSLKCLVLTPPFILNWPCNLKLRGWENRYILCTHGSLLRIEKYPCHSSTNSAFFQYIHASSQNFCTAATNSASFSNIGRCPQSLISFISAPSMCFLYASPYAGGTSLS